MQTHFCYDVPLHDDVRLKRCDSTGLIDEGLLRDVLPTTDAEFFVCGPKPFMLGVLQCLNSLDVGGSSIHYEFFGPTQEMNIANANPHSTTRNAVPVQVRVRA
jgi:nitric oxide dioxygenase